MTLTRVLSDKFQEQYVRCWAEFKYKIGSENVLFKVTTALGPKARPVLVVTHAETGAYVCGVTWSDIVKTRDSLYKNNYRAAGLYAATKALKDVSEARYKKAIKATWDRINNHS